ncbi:uncharacterized protein OCT59_005057 [Rhizophagus irregularis]|uniref:Uncharacterized protein n=2 Tax=Rhizophagus irregularis TaxID=588596 RepID=A0A015N6M6_RHIIW|nr:hypothetical protein RirG_047280 [Rhizophagus irregularis DAOM 197198w]UZO13560.1 hypothetical protein OCT59_005057 [Rhizophagus irregularis]
MSDPVNYNNLRRPKPKSTKGEKTQKKQDRSTDTDDGLFDKSNKKTKIQKFTNDDTYLQTLSKNPSSIINVSASTSTTESTSTMASTSTTVPKDPVESNYTQELLKLIKIAQSNSSRIKNIMDKQEKFEDKFDKKINEQNTLISDILTLLKDREPGKIKGRDKPKKDSDFYQDVVRKLAYEIFHEHKQVTEEQMKTRIKEKLDADEQCVSILQKSEVKGLTFDKLWDKKIKTALLGAIRSKRGYYVRRVKNGLWSIFVYEDLYKSSDAENEDADTYLTLIIKSVFTSEKERTASNGVWVQSVLETIFDINHLSAKIDTDVVDTWTGTEMDSNGDNADESAEYSPTPLYLWTKTNNL